MKKINLLKRAVIRNARSCANSENLAHFTSFEVERDKQGWDFIENATLYGVSGGLAFLSAIGNNPSLSRSASFSPVDTSSNTEISIKYKYKKNRSDSVAVSGKIQFTTSSDPLFSEDKKVEFIVIPDDKWHVYTINMAPVYGWTGVVTNLKIFFATDGRAGDEIHLSYIKIQKPTFNVCTDSCYSDTSISKISDNYNDLDLNSPPIGYSLVNTSANRVVSIVIDPDSSVNRVLSLNHITGAPLGPTVVKSVLSPVIAGFLSLRFYVTSLGGEIKLQKDTTSNIDCIDFKIQGTGKLSYRQGASTYITLDVFHNINTNEWNDILVSFNGTTSTFSIILNGVQLGKDLPYIFSGNIVGIRLENILTAANEFLIDDLLLVEQTEDSIDCPGIGRQGQVIAEEFSNIPLTIQKNVNDSIIVNINNYGDSIIKLPEAIGITSEEIRVLLEKQIAAIDCGGYPYCEVLFQDNKFQIRSGTYGFDSSVEVKKHGDSILSDQLGFTVEGVPVYSVLAGRPNSNSFQFSNTYRALTSDLNSLIDGVNNSFRLLHDPEEATVELGAKFSDTNSRSTLVEGTNKTLIDFYHRGTEEGLIKQITFQGILPTDPNVKLTGSNGSVVGNLFNTQVYDLPVTGVTTGDVLIINTPGYSANGSYSIEVIDRTGVVKIRERSNLPPSNNLTFTIHNIAKVKQFRPRLDGSLFLINEAEIGVQVSGILYTRTPDSHKIDVNWYVHRGDLIGIYNATSIFTGNDPNGDPDALYVDFTGDAVGDQIIIETIEGQGIKGIGLYGSSLSKQKRAVYDIQLTNKQAIDYIDIKAKQNSSTTFYNLTSAIGAGFSLAVSVTGTHVHNSLSSVTGLVEQTIHPNIAYNVSALTDGIETASNGVLGEFEQNDPDAVYFYINGDGEFAGYVRDANGDLIENSLEFPININGGPLLHLFVSDYEDDPYTVLMNWNVPKTLNKFKIYFKDYPNADGYYLEYLKDASQTFDGSQQGFEKIGTGNSSQFTKVYLDKLLITPEELRANEVLGRHLKTDFVGYASFNNPDDGKAFQQIRRFPYTVLEKQFSPITTTAVNWTCNFHSSTKIAEVELFSSTESDSSLDSVYEVYFEIKDGIFQKVEGELIDEETIRFKISYPVKSIRLIVEPTQIIEIDSIEAQPLDDLIRYTEYGVDKPINEINLKPQKGTFSDPIHLQIKNTTGQAADLELSIETDELSDSILLKSSLNTLDETLSPEIGPGGYLLQDKDFDLPTVDNVAVNATCLGLKNLAENKPYYLSDSYDSESDTFLTHVNTVDKWNTAYVNFPKGPPEAFEIKFPGFMVHRVPGSTVPAGTPFRAELVSKWKPLGGGFNASITADHDPRGLRTSPLLIGVGIIDSMGRRIEIQKNKSCYTTGGIPTGTHINSSTYIVKDSLTGVLSSILTYQNDITGTIDDMVPFLLSVTRVKYSDYNVLRFSYVDTTNGTGSAQFSDAPYFEVNLNSLATPLIGDLRVFIYHAWTPLDTPNTTFGTAGSLGNYSRISNFLFGGESTYNKIFFFQPNTYYTSTSGYTNIDNKSLGGAAENKLLALDLGRRYSLDILQTYTKTGKTLWNPLNCQFSNTESSDPGLVSWGNSDRTDVRWILYSEKQIPFVSISGIKYLDYLRVYPDITLFAPEQIINSEWVDLQNILTDGSFNTTLSQIDYPVVTIKLENQFEVSTFKVLDKTGTEFAREGQLNFDGWAGVCDLTISDDIQNDPRLVTWDNWTAYTSPNVPFKPIKWLAFRNKIFDITSGGGTPNKISEVQVSTRGDNLDSIGQTNDRVDFTEYSGWFTVNYKLLTNISLITNNEVDYIDTLFGSSSITSNITGELGNPYLVFDDDTETSISLNNVPANIWRVFGNITITTTEASGTVVSGIDGNTFIVPGQSTTTQDIEYISQIIDQVELTVNSDSPGIPNIISIQTLISGNPSLDSSWSTIYTETSLATQILINTGEDTNEYVFNNGNPLSISFDPAISSSGIRLLITDAVYNTTGDSTFNITNLNIYQISNSITSSGIVQNDPTIRVGGNASLKITYPKTRTEPLKVTAGGNFNILPDPAWSIQDFLSFYLMIDRPDLLNLSECFIRLGKDSTTFYEWNLESLQYPISSVELIKEKLRFLDAINKGEGSIDFANPDLADLESRVDFKNGPLGFFEIEINSIDSISEDINIWLDNFNIDRENFTLPGINPTLYLNNSELLYYPLVDFDIRRGFFEAIITPDWDSSPFLSVKQEEVFTIFTAVTGEDESFSCFYDLREGLTFAISTVEVKTSLIVGKLLNIERYKPIKLSVAWDSMGGSIDARTNSNLRIWINDIVLGDFIQDWNIKKTKDAYFFIGSRAYQSDIATNTINDYLINEAYKILPKSNTLTGGIENILLSNIPKKVEYTDIQYLKDKIYISIDGFTYYNGADPQLPIILYNISNGDIVDVWVKLNMPTSIKNMPRTGFLKSRWRLRG